jgi:hypothetical protein
MTFGGKKKRRSPSVASLHELAQYLKAPARQVAQWKQDLGVSGQATKIRLTEKQAGALILNFYQRKGVRALRASGADQTHTTRSGPGPSQTYPRAVRTLLEWVSHDPFGGPRQRRWDLQALCSRILDRERAKPAGLPRADLRRQKPAGT